MRDAGVEVKAVNPPASGPPLGAIRRDHRKLLAVDGEYASTGGVCIADGWMVRSRETGLPYRDTAISARGPIVADINRAFTGLWGELVEKLPGDERPEPKDIEAAGETAARLVVQEPRKMRTLRMLELLTAGVQERLWVTDPYFLSLPILTQSLMATARDGVDVRILTPATVDIAWIGRVSRAGYRQFLEAGVRIFEDDISNSREIRLEGSGQRTRVRPDRDVDTTDSRVRAGVVGSGTGSGPPSRDSCQHSSRRALPLYRPTSTPSQSWRAAPCSAPVFRGSSPGHLRQWALFSGALAYCARPRRRSLTADRTGRSRTSRSEGWTTWNKTKSGARG
jgi:hypothetical protein